MIHTASPEHGVGPAYLRGLNEREVYRVVSAGGPLHRAEVARLTGLSKPTAAAALLSLVELGLIAETPTTAERPGRATTVFSTVPDVALGLAIDIGARFVRGAVCDIDARVLERWDVALERQDLDTIVEAVEALRNRFASSLERFDDRLAAVIVGSPGVVNPSTGVLSEAGTLPSLDGVVLSETLAAVIGHPVVVENDVNLAAIGEQAWGAGRDVTDFAMISVGTGLGAALVLGGELWRGRAGLAGEVYFVPFSAVAPDDAFIDPSSDNLRELGLRAGYEDVPAIFAGARGGETAAQALVDAEGAAIALYAAAIGAVLDLELVVLTGGIGSQASLMPAIETRLAGLLPHPPRVTISELGTEAVLAGARTLASRSALAAVLDARIG